MQDFTRSSYEYITVDGKEVALTKLHQPVRPEEVTEEQLIEQLSPIFHDPEIRARIGALNLISNRNGKLAMVTDTVLAQL